jgi:YidC/Oxa1 family membrane protein insertase
MEKRTLIAFALSFAVLLLWSYFFTPKVKQQPPVPAGPDVTQKQTETVKPAPPETAPATQAAPEPEPSPALRAEQIEEREIHVETPLYSAVWSNLDGFLKSFKLKKYFKTTLPDSQRVDIVNLEGTEGGLLGFSFTPKGASNTSSVVYETSQTSINIGPDSAPQKLVLTGRTTEGLVLEHTYTFFPDLYKIGVASRVINRTGNTVEGSVTASLINMPPKKGGRSSGYGFTGSALLIDGKLEEIKPKDMKDEEKRLTGRIEWMAIENQYFISAIAPIDAENGTFLGRQQASGAINARYYSSIVQLRTQEQSSSQFDLYFGPRDLTYLKPFGKNLEKAVNFGWTDIIARPLLYTLRFFNSYVNNYGFSILILTVLIKILFWPLTHKSYKSMKEMQKIQPIMAKIREKHKGNKEQMNREMMQLYKTYKVNPMGGCLPMVIQIPVFFALFRILGNSIELRHAPFILWINDLSAPDRLFSFPFDIPLIDPPSGIPVLTLLMGASMFFQQKMTPTPGDPTQAKVMMFLPIIFTFLFINFPSGLVLYWLTNNILSIGQQYRILKKST